jgi:hypothetical protein
MVRLAISVEGQTEQIFVDRLLVPYFQKLDIYISPILLGNGGDVSLSRIKKDLNRLASSFDKVTTLYDFYGFRGKSSDENKESLEQKIFDCVAPALQEKIIPYIQMYEFEGLLFSSPEKMEAEIGKKGLSDWANGILGDFNKNPEAINNSEQTAPSKRLANQVTYIKTQHGPNIAQAIGLKALRENCTGFDGWMTQLEALIT